MGGRRQFLFEISCVLREFDKLVAYVVVMVGNWVRVWLSEDCVHEGLRVAIGRAGFLEAGRALGAVGFALHIVVEPQNGSDATR